jgi:hemerythrin-like domain-containing protein
MQRDKNLIPLSRQHQHALALCVRIDRAIQAGELALEVWETEIQQIYEQEIGIHFAAEEKELFPAALRSATLKPLVDELTAEHDALRDYFLRAGARELSADDLQAFSNKLSTHIRKEERQLFEQMQKLMRAEEMIALGAALDEELKNASQTCALPSPETRLRAKTNLSGS